MDDKNILIPRVEKLEDEVENLKGKFETVAKPKERKQRVESEELKERRRAKMNKIQLRARQIRAENEGMSHPDALSQAWKEEKEKDL